MQRTKSSKREGVKPFCPFLADCAGKGNSRQTPKDIVINAGLNVLTLLSCQRSPYLGSVTEKEKKVL